MVARGKRAFLEYAPLSLAGNEELERVYRSICYGPLLDVFGIDMRSYRGPNTHNLQTSTGDETTFLGRAQLRRLKESLSAARARWKVIAADMLLGLKIADGTDAEGRTRFEAIANGDGPALGRELEIAELLRFIKRQRITNVVWLTADVHYTAAHFGSRCEASQSSGKLTSNDCRPQSSSVVSSAGIAALGARSGALI